MYPRLIESVIEFMLTVRGLLAKHYEESQSYPADWKPLIESQWQETRIDGIKLHPDYKLVYCSVDK